MAAGGPEKIVFVGGAPRSGTTITHALVCTSRRVNEYAPEVPFLRGLPESYRVGKVAWEHHTRAFFDSEEAFRAHIRETADIRIQLIWKRLGEPEILALKDPHLTVYFPELAELYPETARFLTVVRHPYDVVRSRQEVQQRHGAPFGAVHAQVVAEEYVRYYQAAMANDFAGERFVFRYEGLNKPEVQAGIARFVGVEDLHARPMWGQVEDRPQDPWHSPKYFKPIDLERRLSPLSDELKKVTRAICGPLMKQFGYADLDLAA